MENEFDCILAIYFANYMFEGIHNRYNGEIIVVFIGYILW